MASPESAARPKNLEWAYRLWLISAGLLVVVGVLFVVLGVVMSGPTLSPVSIGVIVVVLGVVYGLMGSKAYSGDARWRSSLAALTLVAVMLLVFVSLFANALALALLAAVVGLSGSLLAYRPDSEAWFQARQPKA